MTEEIKLPPFHFTIDGNASLVIEGRDTDYPTITLRNEFKCVHGFPTYTYNSETKIPSGISARLLADERLFDTWINKTLQTVQESIPGLTTASAATSIAVALIAGIDKTGVDTFDVGEEVDSHVRVLARILKDDLNLSRPGQHSSWTRWELMQAVLDAQGRLLSLKQKVTYDSIAEVLKQTHPNEAPPTGNALRVLLRRFKISWKQVKSVQYW
jgi:hypothetical protein